MNITIEPIRRRRDVIVILTIIGKPTLDEARCEIIRKLHDEEVTGEEGPWTIEETPDLISFENDDFGVGISNADIERAIKDQCTTTCWC
jgi:hypothetical protein